MVTVVQKRIYEMDKPQSCGTRYPRDVVMKAVQEARKKLPFYGGLGYSDNSVSPVNRVDIEKASHRLIDFIVTGNRVIGVLETLDTPNGLKLESLLRENKPVDFCVSHITDRKKTGIFLRKSIEIMDVTATYILSITAITPLREGG